MKKSIKKTTLLFMAVLLLCLSGCGSDTTKAFPVKVGEVQILEQPLAVVSLSPSITSSLYALGYGNRVVGVDDRSVRPTVTDEITNCGTVLRPDAETIVALAPDVVFVPTNLPEDEANALLRANITIVTMTRGNTTDSMLDYFWQIATVMEGEEQGNWIRKQLSQYQWVTMNNLYTNMRQITEGVSAIYIAEMDFNLATDDTYMGQVLSDMGFTNQASGEEYTNWNFPAEDEGDLNPDYIFYASHIPIEEIESSPYYQNTQACQNGNLIPIESWVIEEQSPYLFEYLYQTFKSNFPDAFTVERGSIALEVVAEEEPEGFAALVEKFKSLFK